MLTKNFYNIVAQLFRVRKSSECTVTVQDIVGNTQTMTIGADAAQCFPDSLLGSMCMPLVQYHGQWFGTYFGTGKTPATPSDIVMEAPISKDVTNASDCDLRVQSHNASGVIVEINDTYMQLAATHYVTNQTSKTIELTEIGTYGKLKNETTRRPFLLDHTVLEEPILLPPGVTVTVEYVVTFPYGT